jgi:hypothetical protein
MINQTKIQTRKSVTNSLLKLSGKRKKTNFARPTMLFFFAPFVTCVSSTSKFQGYFRLSLSTKEQIPPSPLFFGLLEISFRDRQKTWPFIAAIRSSTFSTVCYTHRQKSLFHFFFLLNYSSVSPGKVAHTQRQLSSFTLTICRPS